MKTNCHEITTIDDLVNKVTIKADYGDMKIHGYCKECGKDLGLVK